MKRIATDGDTPFLPQDIIINILIRLPVKSLIRFQCVCKHWKNLFKTPSFIQDHLHHSSHQNPSLLLPWRHSSLSDLHLDSLDCDMQLREFQNAPYSSEVTIIGSSNGLLCLKVTGHGKYSHSLLLWNPATREFKQLPRTVNDFKRNLFLRFGFISTVNDYKIVRIYMPYNYAVYRVNRVELYSSSTRTWKKVEFGNLKGVRIDSQSVSANGAMFWLGLKGDQCIVSFDTAKEAFMLIPMPELTLLGNQRLTVYENKLAVLSSKKTGEYEYCAELWVMEKGTSVSGEKWNWNKSWTKKYIVRPCPSLLDLYPVTIWMKTIVCVSGFRVNDETKKTLYLFSIGTDEVKRVAVCGDWYYVNFFNYVESLVSVGNIRQRRKCCQRLF